MDAMTQDEIVDIPENRVKFFGGRGKMLLPCPATVAALIEKIPAQRLVTTDLLREKLTRQFEVQGTCPVTTRNALEALAHDARFEVAYWRVINQNGGLISKFPGGVEGHAEHLREEGYTVESDGKTAKVKAFKDSVMRFE